RILHGNAALPRTAVVLVALSGQAHRPGTGGGVVQVVTVLDGGHHRRDLERGAGRVGGLHRTGEHGFTHPLAEDLVEGLLVGTALPDGGVVGRHTGHGHDPAGTHVQNDRGPRVGLVLGAGIFHTASQRIL